MPNLTKTTVGTIFESSSARFLGRIVDTNGDYIVQSDINTINIYIYDASDDTLIDTYLVDKAQVIFDTLQTGGVWTIDSTGYNFSHLILDTSNLLAKNNYKIQYKFVLNDSSIFWCYFILKIREL